MTSTSVHLPAGLLRDLDRAAKERGVSRNRLITEACRSLIDADRPTWPPDFFAPDRLSTKDRRLLASSFADWTSHLQAARTRKAPPF
jgi:hypothetical protein